MAENEKVEQSVSSAPKADKAKKDKKSDKKSKPGVFARIGRWFREVERKVFPGYVLVKMVMNDETWHVVRNIRGVTGFLGEGNKPIPLSEDDVAALGVEKREIVVGYQVGDSVKITDGALESFLGTVEELDLERGKVRVMVSMFGRETPVELELDQVEPMDR